MLQQTLKDAFLQNDPVFMCINSAGLNEGAWLKAWPIVSVPVHPIGAGWGWGQGSAQASEDLHAKQFLHRQWCRKWHMSTLKLINIHG